MVYSMYELHIFFYLVLSKAPSYDNKIRRNFQQNTVKIDHLIQIGIWFSFAQVVFEYLSEIIKLSSFCYYIAHLQELRGSTSCSIRNKFHSQI